MKYSAKTNSYSYISNNGYSTETNTNIKNTNGKISGSTKVYRNGKLISEKPVEHFQGSFIEYDYNLVNNQIQGYYLNAPVLALSK
tara:strand:- start:1025 stop:1279 length:255 start_codon:yes stop_codon:yes gene_type:complete